MPCYMSIFVLATPYLIFNHVIFVHNQPKLAYNITKIIGSYICSVLGNPIKVDTLYKLTHLATCDKMNPIQC